MAPCGIRPILYPETEAGSVAGNVLEIGFHHAFDLQGHRVAAAVQRLACLHADPALADAVFLNVVAFHAVEAHAYATVDGVFIVEAAAGIDGEVVGRRIGHVLRLA